MNGSIGIIFTTDYEIFGNGTGCVTKCVLEPTERMASILEGKEAKLCVFVDVCEYWAFDEEFKKGKLKEDWAGLIRDQLKGLIRRGHDVQLHFHPQWLDYAFDGAHWDLNYDLWRIGELAYEDSENPERGLNNLFARGKETLEGILKPVQQDYVCEIFRAGAWSMQPEADVLKAMRENGFRVDSTVAPGLHFSDSYSYYDFKEAPSNNFFYPIHSSITKESARPSLLELPIHTAEMKLFKKLKYLFLKSKRKLQMKPKGCEGKALASSNRNRFMKLAELLGQKRKMFTFGDATTFEEMRYFANSALNKAESYSGISPVVGISHPKSFANEEELSRFLLWCKNHEQINFTTYQDFYKTLTD